LLLLLLATAAADASPAFLCRHMLLYAFSSNFISAVINAVVSAVCSLKLKNMLLVPNSSCCLCHQDSGFGSSLMAFDML